MNNEKRLTKKDLWRSFVSWHMFAQTCYNYERMQALGFCHSMIPILKRLYNTKEDIAAGLKRHLNFFNTESNLGSFIPGMVAAMEEERANGAEINDDMINGIKTGLMGPLAGVGDTVTQGLVKTILIALGVDLAARGSVLGPILFAVLFTAYTFGLGYYMYFKGYSLGKNALSKIMGTNIMQRITDSMNILGLTVLGALIASRVNIVTPLTVQFQQTSIEIQALLDQIMPKMLSIATVFLIYIALKKNKSIVKILITLASIGIVGALIGIL